MSSTIDQSDTIKSSTSISNSSTNGINHDRQEDDLYCNNSLSLLAWSSILVWPGMMALPLMLTIHHSPFYYTKIFPLEWYDTSTTIAIDSPKPLGLILGIVAVAIGQLCVWIFFYLFKFGYLTNNSRDIIENNTNSTTKKESTGSTTSRSHRIEPISIQTKGSPKYEFMEGLRTHICQPEGFAVLTTYLAITWMFNLMPKSYYEFTKLGGIQYKELFLCLVVQDGIQYIMHRLEHGVSPTFYQYSHKPHHKFLNPRLFDAFNGSLIDTICMIIIPLYITANIVRTSNVWTYMAFGSTYACWLTLIHSEYVFIWDPIFRFLGFGTPADHHVHHAFFKYNYGHLFMWFDQLAGTYHNPKMYVPKSFNRGV
jgi:alternative squalene epoxidase